MRKETPSTMSIRDEFAAAILAAIKESKELGYNPTRFIEMIEQSHPVEIGKKLVVSGDLQSGIIQMAKMNRKDLTIESIMLKPEFSALFTSAELKAAQWRLDNVSTVA